MKHFLVYCSVSAILLFTLTRCSRKEGLTKPNEVVRNAVASTTTGLQCTARPEQTNYMMYRMHNNDDARAGDIAPFYDAAAGNFKLYYLKNVWSSTGPRHPFYGFMSNDFHNYTDIGEIIPSSLNACDQDNAVGAGSVVQSGGTYYFFYTGHDSDNLSCNNGVKREAVMLATSTNPVIGFTKNTNFVNITTPIGIGFDENDNWRDPFVTRDSVNNQWLMLITARKNQSGIWKGVLAQYTSTDLMNWTYRGVFYDGDNSNFFNMECSEVFKMGGYYYLMFSDQSVSDPKTKYVHYRKSTSLYGPWSLPNGSDRFDGNGFFAGRTALNQYNDRYVFGWTNTLTNNSDSGAWVWGGNIVMHKIYPLPNGDLAVAIPHTLKNWLELNTDTLVINSTWGRVTALGAGSYRLLSDTNFNVSNVIYQPILHDRYKINATVNYASCNKDFGFMIGACDGYNNFYSLRFVPSQNRFSFDKTNRSSLTTTTIADNDVPFTMTPNTDMNVQIVFENSVVVVYLNNTVALSCRIYKAVGTNWGIFVDNSHVDFKNISENYQ